MGLAVTSRILLICAASGLLLCPRAFSASAQSCAGGQFTAANIVDLANAQPFSPESYAQCELAGGDCSSLAPQPGGQSQYAQQIVTAINAASTDLKTDLCSLSHIYIDPNPQATMAWALREFTTDGAGHRTYTGQHIGISAQLLAWLNNQLAPFSAYETYITNLLLLPSSQSPQPAPPSSDTVSFVQNVKYSAPADNMTTAILGILGHEMGHILFVENIKNQDNDQHPTRPVGLPCNAQGLKKRFHAYSWPDTGHPFGYHRFGDLDHQHRPIYYGNIEHITAYLQTNDTENARNYLYQLYGGKEWASLFATVAVDEDFVETYMLHQLQAGNVLSSFTVTIPPATAGNGEPNLPVDVMRGFADSSSKLAQKAAWIDQCITRNASAPGVRPR